MAKTHFWEQVEGCVRVAVWVIGHEREKERLEKVEAKKKKKRKRNEGDGEVVAVGIGRKLRRCVLLSLD